MLARCPHCRTTFAVSAAALRAARGRVRCGACLEPFDALETLIDEERERSPEPPPGTAPEAPAPAAGETRAAPAGGASEASAEEVPEALVEDLRRYRRARRARLTSTLLTAASLLLVVLAVAQIAWFQPGAVLARYPRAAPLLERYCARLGCTLPQRRDPGRITVLTRDVRVHPRYEGALRVVAVIMNTAPFAQPYPRMRFALFNVNGQTIASRTFTPPEYLGEAAPRTRLMEPNRPVQLALELLAPEEAAVSFEFAFL